MDDLRYNWYGLILAVEKGLTPEAAFSYLATGQPQRPEITQEDVAEMARLKETLTYKQIGALYGLTDQAVYKQIKRRGLRNASKKALLSTNTLPVLPERNSI